MELLIEKIKQWGIDKGITGPDGKGTLLGQFNKAQEELNETRDAAVFYSEGYDFMWRKKNRPVRTKLEMKDGIGDTTITLILAAEMAGLDYMQCVQCAYNEIKGRTGEMIDGVFVKNN